MSRRLIALLLAVLPLFAQKQPPSDNYIYDQVRIRLSADVEVKGANLAIAVKEGVVTIKGFVETDKARQKAEKIAKKVKGVRSVVNELKVDTTKARTT
ncbi:MAG: BON domain-containing protein [Bryobacteraceae bacterium]